MIGFCLSRRGKIATADVMGCDGCDWSDAPDRTGGCYPPVTFGARSRRRGRYCPGVLRIGLTGGIGSGKSTVSAAPGRARCGHRGRRPRSPARWSSRARRAWPPSSTAFGAGVLAADGVAGPAGAGRGRLRRPGGAAPAGRDRPSAGPGPGHRAGARPRRRTPSSSTTCRCSWRPARRAPTTSCSSWRPIAETRVARLVAARADGRGRPRPHRGPGHRRAAAGGRRRRPGQQRHAGASSRRRWTGSGPSASPRRAASDRVRPASGASCSRSTRASWRRLSRASRRPSGRPAARRGQPRPWSAVTDWTPASGPRWLQTRFHRDRAARGSTGRLGEATWAESPSTAPWSVRSG